MSGVGPSSHQVGDHPRAVDPDVDLRLPGHRRELAGLAVDSHVPGPLSLAVGTGWCGALTTYGTFSYETLRLFEEGVRPHAVVDFALTLVAGLGTAAGGFAVGAALAGG